MDECHSSDASADYREAKGQKACRTVLPRELAPSTANQSSSLLGHLVSLIGASRKSQKQMTNTLDAAHLRSHAFTK